MNSRVYITVECPVTGNLGRLSWHEKRWGIDELYMLPYVTQIMLMAVFNGTSCYSQSLQNPLIKEYTLNYNRIPNMI